MHRSNASLCYWLLCGLLMPGGVSAANWLPLSLSGSLGFNYRTLDGSDGQKTISRQGTGSLYANSYVWRPWFATTDLSLTLALDNSDSDDGSTGGYISTESSIFTGVLNLNVLPQSRTPFNLRYSATDTRVDNTAVSSDAFIVLGDGDARTYKLGLTQAFISKDGHRLRAIYDNNRWSSERNGDYDDETAAVEIDVRGARQRLTFNGKIREAERSVSSETNESALFDVTHYYFPTSALRVDTRASYYDIERGFDVPSTNPQSGTSNSDIRQASSFLFWRPTSSSPWTVSGGVRLYNLEGENSGQSNESENMSATLGTFYQFNKRLRFDLSGAYSETDSNQIESEVTRYHGGALYQSDLHNIAKFTYQWYADGSGDSTDDGDGHEQVWTAAAGHNLQRSWFTGGSTSFRLSFGQTLTQTYFTETEDNDQRFENTITLNWNQTAGGGTSYALVTLSDRRNFGDNESDQQMVWFQAYRDQRISRRSTLSGNISTQYVNHNFAGIHGDTEVTTATAKINYRNAAIFGIPKLGFISDWMFSRASEDEGVDRQEWENRLDYAVGQLTTSLSYRLIEHDDQKYDLTFFRIQRHF